MASLTQSQRDLLARVRAMRLPGFAEGLKNQWELPSVFLDMSFDDRIKELLREQEDYAAAARSAQLLKNAKIPGKLELDEILSNDERGLSNALKAEISSLRFVSLLQNIVISGQTSSGKSTLAQAIGRLCCRRSIPVRYCRAHDIIAELDSAYDFKAKMTIRNRLKRFKILILDDFGMHPLTEGESLALYDILEDRTDIGPVIITTQLTQSGLAKAMKSNKQNIDGNMRRIIQRSIKIKLIGDIYSMTGGESFESYTPDNETADNTSSERQSAAQQ